MRSGTDVQRNIDDALAAIETAAKVGAKFIATPEMTHLMQQNGKAKHKQVKTEEKDLGVAAFSEAAAKHGVTLLIGSLGIKREDSKKIANRSFVFDPHGTMTASYDKIHMFDAAVSKEDSFIESKVIAAGEAGVIAPVGDLQMGLTICYDLRFPAQFAAYAKAEVEMIAVPAAFTVPTGKAHWEVLLRARAIETGAYIIAPAQGGAHADGRKTWGRSMVVDPWGKVVAKLDHNRPGILYANINPAKVADARAKIPAWRSH